MTALPLTDLLEKEWAAQVYDLCRLTGWTRYHTWRAKHSPAGFPDETLWRDRVVFLELKREKTKTSPAQKTVIRGLLAADAEVYIVRPRDLDDLAAVLRRRKGRETAAGYQAAERLAAATRREVEAG